jgi:hypothetical protein
MGRSYFVPRSVKGESRILYIFTIKSFVTTLGFGVVGFFLWNFLKLFGIGDVVGIIITLIFGGLGYVFGAVTIPDIPMMGAFRKAGGENISNIVLRFITFRGRKKIYTYNLNRGGK